GVVPGQGVGVEVFPGVVADTDFDVALVLFALDRQLQAREGVIPLVGDALQAAAGLFQLARFYFPQAFSTYADVADQAGFREDVQVFGDRLTSDVGARGEAR